MLYHWASRFLFMLGSLLIFMGASYGALVGYLAWQESVSPSTARVLVLKDGRRIPLLQPTVRSGRRTIDDNLDPGSTDASAGIASPDSANDPSSIVHRPSSVVLPP